MSGLVLLFCTLFICHGYSVNASNNTFPNVTIEFPINMSSTLQSTSYSTTIMTTSALDNITCVATEGTHGNFSNSTTIVDCPGYCGASLTDNKVIGGHHKKGHGQTTHGCPIPWLCKIIAIDLDGHNESTCAVAELVQHSLEVVCPKHLDSVHHVAAIKQLTYYKRSQFCCESDFCNEVDSNETVFDDCSLNNGDYSDGYTMFYKELYQCAFAEESSVVNTYNIINTCVHGGARNLSTVFRSYENVCDYLLSETYSHIGCNCKAGIAVARKYDIISGAETWVNTESSDLNESLRLYGCATDLFCYQEDGKGSVGLLDIVRDLFKLSGIISIPVSSDFDNSTDWEAYIEGHIDQDVEKIYIENIGTDDPHSQYVIFDVLVVFLNSQDRDEMWEVWRNETDVFGDGSEVTDIDKINVNDTIQYYGSAKYYGKPDGGGGAGNPGVVSFAVCITAFLFGLIGLFVWLNGSDSHKGYS